MSFHMDFFFIASYHMLRVWGGGIYESDHFYDLCDKYGIKVYVSQVMQGEAMVIAMEAHRRNMPWCQGSLICQVNDCWPCN